MKHLMNCISVCMLLLLAACNNEDEPGGKDTPWYFGYFKGDVNEQSVTVENTQEENPIKKIQVFVNTKEDLTPVAIPIHRYCITFPIFGEGQKALDVKLAPVLKLRTYEMQGDSFSPDSASVHVMSEADYPKNLYYPVKTPFKIKITRLEYPSRYADPIIEGTMDGVLYNLDNLQDSIIIKNATFGMR